MFFYLFWNVKQIREMTGNPDFNMEYHTAMAEAAVKVREKTGKPLVAVLLDIASHPDHADIEQGRMEAREHFTKNKVACFDTGLQAFSALRRVADYYTRRQALQKEG